MRDDINGILQDEVCMRHGPQCYLVYNGNGVLMGVGVVCCTTCPVIYT